MMHIFQDKMVNCRTDHKCEWCGELIEKGSKAQYRAYIHDGVFQSQWQHPECYDAMNDTDESFWQGEMGRGSVYMSGEEPEEQITEHNEG